MKTLKIPRYIFSSDYNMPTIEDVEVKSPHSFVIVGANGSGKSKLGAYLEKENSNKTLRISAQRALSVPDKIIITDEDSQLSKIMFGSESSKNIGYKWGGGHYSSRFVDDYTNVLSLLFARVANEQREYFEVCRLAESQNQTKPNTPITIADNIYNIWNSIYPHRTLLLKDTKVAARIDDNTYNAKEMSDGERVASYLIAQCLLAPNETIIIIDEPELHLHKAIMHRLWDLIEELSPNKTFVYITHDLDFAASRQESTKIWVKSYKIEQRLPKWDIEILNDTDEIPNQLLLEVLGSRKKTLFVEGERGSYDTQLYSYIYNDYYVIPRGGHDKVIEATKAFNAENIQKIHTIEAYGIIDRDYMTEHEISKYNEAGIYTLDVSEVENLYLLEDIMRTVAENQCLENIDETIDNIKSFLFEEFQKEYDVQLTSMCEKEIQFRLNKYSKQENTLESLKQRMTELVSIINIDNIHNESKAKIDNILSAGNINSLLKIYNRKSLHKRISPFFKLANNEYPNLVLRLLKGDKKDRIVKELRNYTPTL